MVDDLNFVRFLFIAATAVNAIAANWGRRRFAFGAVLERQALVGVATYERFLGGDSNSNSGCKTSAWPAPLLRSYVMQSCCSCYIMT